MEEANAEVEHKGYCDKELATNEHTRKEKTEAVVMLTAEVDELTASIAALGEQIVELTKAIQNWMQQWLRQLKFVGLSSQRTLSPSKMLRVRKLQLRKL